MYFLRQLETFNLPETTGGFSRMFFLIHIWEIRL